MQQIMSSGSFRPQKNASKIEASFYIYLRIIEKRFLYTSNLLHKFIRILLDIFSFVSPQTKVTAPLVVSSRPTLAEMSRSMVYSLEKSSSFSFAHWYFAREVFKLIAKSSHYILLQYIGLNTLDRSISHGSLQTVILP